MTISDGKIESAKLKNLQCMENLEKSPNLKEQVKIF